MLPSEKQKSGPLKTLALLSLLLTLYGCQTTQPAAPSPLPKLTTPPALRTQLPSEAYTESVRKHLLSWESELRATSATSK